MNQPDAETADFKDPSLRQVAAGRIEVPAHLENGPVAQPEQYIRIDEITRVQDDFGIPEVAGHQSLQERPAGGESVQVGI
ncbi:hypothetical protein JCM30471_05430 [Desulfuromonas carbonis]